MTKKNIFKKAWKHFRAHRTQDLALVFGAAAFLVLGGGILWISSFRLPDLSSFDQRKIPESTKIYDRTGTVLLFDLHENVKRTVVPLAEISPYIQKATIAIEDATFYEHGGIKPTSIIRAVLANLRTGSYGQGGSTITQQVIKNTVLTTDKTITRKLKEWVLAVKLDGILTKERILELYLNETAYGGNIYGIEEAAKQFLGKSAKDVTLAEAAYLAAIPQATTYYSPHGKNLDALEKRKNLVLTMALENGFITKEEYDGAMAEKVEFTPRSQYGIRAPHFVFFVKDYLEKVLDLDSLDEAGYKVITTLDAAYQEKAEALVKATAIRNTQDFEAENAALVALDPKNGDILAMVGSRDYFDKQIDGQFNVATAANRQPGSTMKPIVYARAFMEGYTPDTVLFDLETEFSTQCTVDGKPKDGSNDTKKCYHPRNYDEVFRGPITLREALAQSINIPSIKLLYLAGVRDSLALAKDMGITSLAKADQYGLTLVLGGGEISLLEMTSAYGTFANDGTHVPYRPVLRVFDAGGREINVPSERPIQAMPANVARTVSDVLSDNVARTPAYGPNSVLYFADRDVAVKTGTTNDSVDAWTIGYSPNVVVGVWAGNNAHKPMVKKVAGQIVAPLWNAAMAAALEDKPYERFVEPTPADPSKLKPVLKGEWRGGETYVIDTISGKLATDLTPPETREERAIQSVHSILHWLDKNDPLGAPPSDPTRDSQYEYWETPVRAWAAANGYFDQDESVVPRERDNVHTEQNSLSIGIEGVNGGTSYSLDDTITVLVAPSGRFSLSQASLYVNGVFVGTTSYSPFMFRFSPREIPNIQEVNEVRVVGVDSIYNRAEAKATMRVSLDG